MLPCLLFWGGRGNTLLCGKRCISTCQNWTGFDGDHLLVRLLSVLMVSWLLLVPSDKGVQGGCPLPAWITSPLNCTQADETTWHHPCTFVCMCWWIELPKASWMVIWKESIPATQNEESWESSSFPDLLKEMYNLRDASLLPAPTSSHRLQRLQQKVCLGLGKTTTFSFQLLYPSCRC